MEAVPTGMIMIDTRGRIVLTNGRLEKLFGYDRALMGKSIEVLVSPCVGRHKRHQHRTYEQCGDVTACPTRGNREVAPVPRLAQPRRAQVPIRADLTRRCTQVLPQIVGRRATLPRLFLCSPSVREDITAVLQVKCT